MKKAIGIDIGGTKIAVAAVDQSGTILSERSVPTHPRSGFSAGVERMLAAIVDIMNDSRLRWSDLSGIGVGCTGPVEPQLGILHNSETLPTWEGCNLMSELHRRCGVPVLLENDADTAALGESLYGSGRGAQSIVMLTFGTGVGSSIVWNGWFMRGLNACHPEFGHMVVAQNGKTCGCGARGCLESVAGGLALADAGKAAGFHDAANLFQAAYQGQEAAVRIVAAATEAVGIAAWNIFHMFAPHKLILGGGVMDSHFSIFADKIDEILQKSSLIPYSREQVVPAQLGNRAGVIGSAALWWKESE